MPFKTIYHHWLIYSYFRLLNRLQRAYFKCFQKDYLKEKFLLEKKIQKCHYRIARILQKMNRIYFVKETSFKKLYYMTCALGQLRIRVLDRALFSICENELFLISYFLSKNLNNAAFLFFKQKPSAENEKSLNEKIENFSMLYHGTLRIVALEPLVFLFFIQALNKWTSTFFQLFKESWV